MQKLSLSLVTRDSMDCYYRCLTILSMFPITFINLKTPRLCLWRRRSWGCGCSVNRACKYLTKNLCLQPLITGSVNIRDPNRQKNLKSTICNWSDHAILGKKITIWKPLRRKNAASDTSKVRTSSFHLAVLISHLTLLATGTLHPSIMLSLIIIIIMQAKAQDEARWLTNV